MLICFTLVEAGWESQRKAIIMLCSWPEGKFCRENVGGFSSFLFFFFFSCGSPTQKFKDRCSVRLIHLILLVPQFKVSSVLSKRGLFALRSIQTGSAGGGLLGFCSLGKRQNLLWGHLWGWIMFPEVSLWCGWDEGVLGRWEASDAPALLRNFGRPTLALEPGAVCLKKL